MRISRLLLVDDDRSLSQVVAAALTEEGYQVEVAHDGRAGLNRFQASTYDLLLLDVLMPELDGFELCRRVRAQSKVPIIFLTSRSETIDRVSGLELGADDYLAKPFDTRELVARIRAIDRRLSPVTEAPPDAERIVVGQLQVDLGRFEVRWRDQRVELTRSELLVLAALARRQGFVLSREQLIDSSKGAEVVITERTVDTFIKRIRAKLREVDSAFDAIETVIGVGYRLRGA